MPRGSQLFKSTIAFLTCIVMLHAAGKPVPAPGLFDISHPALATEDISSNLRLWDLTGILTGSVRQTWAINTTRYGDLVFVDIDKDGQDELITSAICSIGRKNVSYQNFLNVYRKGTGTNIAGFPGLWATTYYSLENSMIDSIGNSAKLKAVVFPDGDKGVVALTKQELAVFVFNEARDAKGNFTLTKTSWFTFDTSKYAPISLAAGSFGGVPTVITNVSDKSQPVNTSILMAFGVDNNRELSPPISSASTAPYIMWSQLVIGDSNGNALTDSIWSVATNSYNSIFLCGWSFDGNSFASRTTILVREQGFPGPKPLAMGNIIKNDSGDEIAIGYLGTSDGTTDKIDIISPSTGRVVSTSLNSNPAIVISKIVIADVNGDGIIELVAAGRGSGTGVPGSTYLEVFSFNESSSILNSLWKRTGASGEEEISAIATGN